VAAATSLDVCCVELQTIRDAGALILDLRIDAIPALIRKIALPASAGMLFSVLMNIVDTAYAGMLSATALAALSLAGPVFFLVLTVGIGTGQATNALVGNALGADQPERARHLALQSIAFATIISIIAALLVLAMLTPLLELMGGEDPYLQPARQYITVVLSGAALFSLSFSINGILNTRGDTKTYRNAQFAAVLANIALDPLFMFTFGLGVTGVAVATVLIQLGVVVYLFSVVLKLDFMRAPALQEFVPNIKAFTELAKQSIPTSLSMLLVAVGSVIIVAYVSRYGESAMAAYGVALRIEQLILLPVIGINIAALSLTGVNYGANQLQRVRTVFSTGVTYAVGLMVIGAFPLVMFGEQLMRLFTDEQAVVDIGVNYLKIEALILPAYAVTFLCSAMLQGLKRPQYTLYCNVFRQIIAQLLLFHLVVEVLELGISSVWYSVLAINWVMAGVIWWFYNKRINSIENDITLQPEQQPV